MLYTQKSTFLIFKTLTLYKCYEIFTPSTPLGCCILPFPLKPPLRV
jgi:hypothetical protein